MGPKLGEACSGTEKGWQADDQHCDLVVVDLRLGDECACDLLETLRQAKSRFAWVVMTANPSIAEAVEAMRRVSLDEALVPLASGRVRAVIERPIGHGGPGIKALTSNAARRTKTMN